MTTELGAAVVGLGVGAEHARAYAATPGCRLRWVYDVDPSRMAPVVAALGQGAAAGSLATILGDRATDVVSIASYDDAHYDQTKQALTAGKHVFVEKPLCRSMSELRDIKETWQERGRPHLQSNLVLRSAPMYQWLKSAIACGELGSIYAFDGEYLYGRLEKITLGWRRHVRDYSVIQGGAVHLIDLMLWLTGQRPARVVAVGNRVCTAGSEFMYPDYVTALYEFEGGQNAMVGRITANFGCVHQHQHVVRVFGTKATFLYDDLGARLHKSRDPDAVPVRLPHAALPQTKGDLLAGFIDGIRSGRDPTPAAQHDFDVISASLAADEALALNGFRQIEYV